MLCYVLSWQKLAGRELRSSTLFSLLKEIARPQWNFEIDHFVADNRMPIQGIFTVKRRILYKTLRDFIRKLRSYEGNTDSLVLVDIAADIWFWNLVFK